MDKIVIIEDDPGIRTVLRLALKGAGFQDVIAEERGDSGKDHRHFFASAEMQSRSMRE